MIYDKTKIERWLKKFDKIGPFLETASVGLFYD